LDNTSSSLTDSPRNPLAEVTLEQLPDNLQKAAARAGWNSLVAVQARAIPYLLAGRNMMIQARTGSGKTGVFLLPMLARLDPAKAACQALILVPTRELARQVWQETERYAAESGLRTVAVYGGVGYGAQTSALKAGAHIVVGTPGRVLDHLLNVRSRSNSLECWFMMKPTGCFRWVFILTCAKPSATCPNAQFITCMFRPLFHIRLCELRKSSSEMENS